MKAPRRKHSVALVLAAVLAIGAAAFTVNATSATSDSPPVISGTAQAGESEHVIASIGDRGHHAQPLAVAERRREPVTAEPRRRDDRDAGGCGVNGDRAPRRSAQVGCRQA